MKKESFSMKKTDFFYDLPESLIAQHPEKERSSSRMLLLDPKTGKIGHSHFYDLGKFLAPGDLLVLNDSRVLPARLCGERLGSGGFAEFLLLKPRGEKCWEIICRPGKKCRPGAKFTFGGGRILAEILEVLPDGNRVASFECEGNFYTALEDVGQMPLPPYIKEKLKDKERYQTVYAQNPGSAAAPTAGLHFTESLLENLKAQGIGIAYVTLHVGLGTFRPVREENIENHHMHTEHFFLPKETADAICHAKKNKGRVIAVGTTSCRTLESAAALCGETLHECAGDTDIFIYPGYHFQVMDGLITNFHLPESTLIMLVAAFAGYWNTMYAYRAAVKEKYRFFSFGDCMCILPGIADENN